MKNTKNENGNTFMCKAACDGDIKMVVELLEIGVDVSFMDNYDLTSWRRALTNGHIEVATKLIEVLIAYHSRWQEEVCIEVAAELTQALIAHHSHQPVINIETKVVSLIQDLIRTAVSVSTKNENGDMLMHISIKKNYCAQMVIKLLEVDANPDATSDKNETLLRVDRRWTNLSIVDILELVIEKNRFRRQDIEEYADDFEHTISAAVTAADDASMGRVCRSDFYDAFDSIRDKTGNTALHLAIGHPLASEIIDRLLEAGPDRNTKNRNGETPLHLAASINDIEAIRSLGYSYEYGCNIVDTDSENRDRDTPYHLAAANGYADAIMAIHSLEYADIKVYNQRNDRGETPLHLATEHGHNKTISTLIDYDADVNMANEWGDIPLHLAARNGHTEAITALLKAGATVNAKNEIGLTPLHFAVANGHTEAIIALLENDADVNLTTNKNGFTPLHSAARINHSEIIAILAEAGARINVVNKHGLSPLHLAAREDHIEAITALEKAGADVDMKAKNDDGHPPLHLAAKEGHTQATIALLDAGANPLITDNENKTALDLARHHKKWSVAEKLNIHLALQE